MIGFGILVLSGAVKGLNPKPLLIYGSVIGGVVFGMGMVLAAGCASGTTYRVGEGMVGSLVALGGFCLGLVMAKFGILAPAVTALQTEKVAGLTLFGDLTPTFMIILGAVGLVAALYFWVLPARKERTKSEDSTKDKILKNGWPWYSTGIIIGIVNVVAWLVAWQVASFNYALGISGGWLSNIQWLLTGDPVTKFIWFGWIVIGIVVGGFVGAIVAGEFKLRAPKDAKILLQQLIGGIIMGIGAIIAMGCNIGNLLSGIPQLSVGSIVVGVSIVLGCWIMTYLMFMRGE